MSKKLSYLVFFISVLGLALTSIAKGADPDLLVWYMFDETSGTTASDSSGNGHDGTFMGNPQWAPGKIYGALEFDGAGDYVEDPDGGNYLNGLEALTVCVWVKSDVISTNKGFIHFGPGGDRGGMRYDSSGADGGGTNTLKIGINTTGAAGAEQQLEGSNNLQTTTWQHYTMVWITGEQLMLYVNGVLDSPTSNEPATTGTTVGFTTLIVGMGAKDSFSTGGWDGLIDDVRIYSRALTQEEIQQVMVGIPPALASNPSPADEATDVPREVVLSWTPGEYAPPIGGHKVYLSESFNDVNDGIGGIAQDANSYARPQRLEFGTTYYWRVDEVNAPPDSTIFEGEVWSFTTEPIGYPIENITATASSTHQVDMGPENTINGSGLDANDLHSNEPTDMWLSGNEPLGAWIEYEFDKVYKLHELWVWNSNQTIESLVGFGLKDVTIEYSTNGTDYTTLGATHEFAQALGADGYAHNTTIDFGGVAAKYVKLTAQSNRGFLAQYGLSEVRFLYIPIRAREASPDSGATDVDVDVVLGWTSGREAVTHDVYLSTDEQAVMDGTALVATVTEARHGPLSLDLDVTHYWRVDEVNEAETPTTLEGDLWNFTTRQFLVVDDFESYNDLDPADPASNRIFNVWIDGYEVPTNGSLVGYENPPFCERTIVRGGKQSIPLAYSNTGGAAYSEVERTFAAAQNWAVSGVQTLVVYFHGTEGNTGQLYVKVNGSKVVYGGDAGDIAKVEWKQWNIDLASLGVNLQNITKLAIGIDGNGASGTLYVDDIRLYPLP